MLRWLKETWDGSNPVEFESAFGLPQTVERLRAATKRSMFSAMQHEQAVGMVNEGGVSLHRAIPMMGNAFKPIFVGSFQESGGKVMLRGRFTMHWFPKVFMLVWFGLVALVAVGVLVAAIRSDAPWPVALGPIGMLGAGIALVRSGQWFSRNDPAWLSEVIRSALSMETLPAGAASVRASAARPPIHVLAFILLLGFFGVLALASAATGVEGLRIRPGGPVIAYLEDDVARQMRGLFGAARQMRGLFGVATLAWGYGVYRLYRLAWWIGAALLACLEIGIVRDMVLMPSNAETIFDRSMGLLIWGIFLWWWYGQRNHFHK